MLISMRLLGIDYGSKRVGIALSDDKGLMAFPHSVIKNDDVLLESILEIIDAEKVEMIVVGHSFDREGGLNPIHEDASKFIDALRARVTCAIELEPEQYTTQEAVRFQGKTEHTDSAAASIILNSYIMRNKNKENHD